ncbi:hypothetical protein ONZ45_g19158 [Pleurotus djamor]|nr:hypothetical protein ONZ45_g19158 [Pleurotus djamor]
MPPTITIVSTVPKFVSLEEHRTIVSTTPASFSDIPPRHPTHRKRRKDHPRSTHRRLFRVRSVLVFLSSSSGRAIQIQYPSITLHAISRAENTPSIYCQLDESQNTTTTTTTQDDNETVDMREMSIIPVSSSSLEAIFEALSLCASLHPDEDTGDDEDEDDAFISTDSPFETFNGDENQELSDVGRAALEHLESIIDYGSHKPPIQDDDDKDKPTTAKEGETEKTEPSTK